MLAGIDPAALGGLVHADERPGSGIEYRHAAISIDRLEEMRAGFEKITRSGRISDQPTFLEYLSNKDFSLPDSMKDARSIILVATFTPMMLVTFHFDGTSRDLAIPPQYYDDGITIDDIKGIIRESITGDPDSRLEWAGSIPLKTAAVRSGLAEYGRNNICYVDGMGSFLTIYGFFCDSAVKNYGWRDLKAMDRCGSCAICLNRCPTHAIRTDDFVIDAGRCITLYNEVAGDFPGWIPGRAHNSLMGCMDCQIRCPANRRVLSRSGRLDDVTEEETRAVLGGKADDALMASLGRKLKGYSGARSADDLPIFTRNLSAVLNSGRK